MEQFETRWEKLKKALFMNGHNAIEDFLGYEYPDGEDRDITDRRLDMRWDEMAYDDLKVFYKRYDIGLA